MKKYLLLVALCLISAASFAEMRQYKLSVTYGSGYDMSSGTTALWIGGSGSRFFAASATINIGFTFSLDKVDYTQLKVYTCGVISLGSGTLVNYWQNNLTNANSPVIAPFWDSIPMTGTQGGCAAPKIHYKLFGTAPNRVFVVEWYDQETYHTVGSRGTFQARLYEDGKIEYWYKSMSNCSKCGNTNGQCRPTAASIGLASSSTNFLSITPQFDTATTDHLTANNSVNIDPAFNPIDTNILYTLIRVPAAQLKVSTKTLNFGTTSPNAPVVLCVTVKNVGTEGPLTFNAPTTNVAGYTEASAPAGLAPGDSANYCIRFNPPGAGTFAGVYTINSNGLDSGSQGINVTGTSVLPTIEITPLGNNLVTRLFRGARVRLGDTLEQKFIVKNIGVGYLVIDPTSPITGDVPFYYAISRVPGPLANGESDTVALKFFPRREGVALAVLDIVNNSENGTQVMDLVGTGVLPRIVILPSNNVMFDSVGFGDTVCKRLTIYNSGSDTLVIKNQYYTYVDAGFSFTPLTGTATRILPLDSGHLDICFSPRNKGNRVAGIRLLTNIPMTFEALDGEDDGDFAGPTEEFLRRDTSAMELSLAGVGVPLGVLFSDKLRVPTLVDSSFVGKEHCIDVDISNPGDDAITINTVTFTGDAAGDYTIKGLVLPKVLQPKQKIFVQLCATPAERGDRLVNLEISGSTESRTSKILCPVNVKGIIACVKYSSDSVFVNTRTYVSQKDTEIVVVTNCGDLTTTYSASVTGTDYSVTAASIPNVPPGGTVNVAVVFHPTSRGMKTGTLTVTAPGLAPINIVLRGEGICSIPEAPENVNAPGTAVGDTSEFEINVANSGNGDLVLGPSFITPEDVYTVIRAKSDTVIPAGGSGKVVVAFHPIAEGVATGVLTYANAGPCKEGDITINLFGTGTPNAVRDSWQKDGFVLYQNTPNPANGSSSIAFVLPNDAFVKLTLTDMTGKVVKELYNARGKFGENVVSFMTANIPSGSYIYTLESNGVRLVRQMIITK